MQASRTTGLHRTSLDVGCMACSIHLLHLQDCEWCDKLAGDHLVARAVQVLKGNCCKALRSRFDEPAGILHAIQMEIRSWLDLITFLRRSSVRGALLKDLCRLTKVWYHCNAEKTRCMNEFAPVFLFSLGFGILVRFRAAVAGFRTRFNKQLFYILKNEFWTVLRGILD